MDERAIQDQIRGNTCFGCGAGNDRGLRLKSFWNDGDSIATFLPRPEHAAGPPHVLNGGILATILDCHSVCTAIAFAYRAEARPIGSEPFIWCVTASLKVDYRQPAAIDAPVHLRARIRESDGRKIWVDCTASSEGEEVATARVLAVRVPESFRKR